MEGTKKKYRMGWMGITALIGAAAIADLFSLIPFVGTLVGPIFWICASIYLWKIGCGLLNTRRLATSIISMVAEIIPVVQGLPLILAGIITVIVMVRIEDKTGIKLPTPGAHTPGKVPLYSEGRRAPSLSNMTESSAPFNVDGIRAPNGGLRQ